MLFETGEPLALAGYRQGRPATRAELAAAIEQGLPALREAAVADGPAAVAQLLAQLAVFEDLLAQHIPEGEDATNRPVSAQSRGVAGQGEDAVDQDR